MKETLFAIGPMSWLFLLCCAFAAQYWIYRAHGELKKMNEKLDELIAAQQRKG